MIKELDYMNEDGVVDKKKYLKTLPELSKNEVKKFKKKFKAFVKDTDNRYYRIKELDTDMSLVYHLDEEVPRGINDLDEFYKSFLLDIQSAMTSIRAMGYSDKRKESLEVWGVDCFEHSRIFYFYPYDKGVIEV